MIESHVIRRNSCINTLHINTGTWCDPTLLNRFLVIFFDNNLCHKHTLFIQPEIVICVFRTPIIGHITLTITYI